MIYGVRRSKLFRRTRSTVAVAKVEDHWRNSLPNRRWVAFSLSRLLRDRSLGRPVADWTHAVIYHSEGINKAGSIGLRIPAALLLEQ